MLMLLVVLYRRRHSSTYGRYPILCYTAAYLARGPWKSMYIEKCGIKWTPAYRDVLRSFNEVAWLPNQETCPWPMSITRPIMDTDRSAWFHIHVSKSHKSANTNQPAWRMLCTMSLYILIYRIVGLNEAPRPPLKRHTYIHAVKLDVPNRPQSKHNTKPRTPVCTPPPLIHCHRPNYLMLFQKKSIRVFPTTERSYSTVVPLQEHDLQCGIEPTKISDYFCTCAE